MKIRDEVHADVIIDALDMKFSKDAELNQKIMRLLRKTDTNGDKVVDPVEIFAFRAEDTLLLIKRNHPQKVRHLIFLDSHTQEPFHIRNIENFKVG